MGELIFVQFSREGDKLKISFPKAASTSVENSTI